MTAAITLRRVRGGELVDAYPSGTHDWEMHVEGRPASADVSAVAAQVFVDDPLCRRIVLPLPERDLYAIAWAEESGFRYVVDVETRSGGGYSLMVLEPHWVLAQPQILDDIPLKD